MNPLPSPSAARFPLRRLYRASALLAGGWALQMSAAPASAQSGSYALTDAFPGLKFDQPLGVVVAPGDKDRVFILEKTGCVQTITLTGGKSPEKQLFLDLRRPRDGRLETEGECGLLGLAFPADYRESRRCFVYYSLKTEGKLYQRVSRFPLAAGEGMQAEQEGEQVLFSQEDAASNHNGGDLQFGPDHYLYISTGDGGRADDNLNEARFIDKGFHAAILRIDVDKRAGSLPPNAHPGIALDESGAAFYAVPADNPFVKAQSYHGRPLEASKVRTEVWATGFRNPWRISFDPPTGRLFTGDVGQNLYEEVDIVVKGGDYGWSYREGLHPFPQGPGKTKLPEDFKPVEPIFVYPRATGISVTGGMVYRGPGHAVLKGAYLFADYGSGVVMALHERKGGWVPQTLAREAGIAGTGTDPRDGEMLFAGMANGRILKLTGGPKPAAAKP